MATDYRLSTIDSLSKRDRLRWAALLVALCAITYANGTFGAFTYDDKAIVRDNPRIRSPRSVRQIFTTSYFGSPRGTGSAYRPLLLLSYAVEWWIHGKDVVAFHVANVCFHALATLLVAVLLLRLDLPPPTVAAASLLFAVHPIHVEAVTSLVGRGETQSALFVLLYLHCALWLWRANGEGRTARASQRSAASQSSTNGEGQRDVSRLPSSVFRFGVLLVALFCYTLALLTKESAAVAPALAFLLFLFLGSGTLLRRGARALVREWPLWLSSAAVLAAMLRLRAWVLGGALRAPNSGIFEVENALAPLSPGARAANSVLVFFRYLGRCVLPLHLSGDESAWSIRPVSPVSPLAIGAVSLLIVLLFAACAKLPRRSSLALGFLFFGLALLPTGNLLFPIGTIFAERLAYLPSIGVCLVLGVVIAGRRAEAGGAEAGGEEALDSPSPRPSPGGRGSTCAGAAAARDAGTSLVRRRALFLLVTFFAARSILRNAVWWTDEGLFANLIATSPDSAKAHYDVAYVAVANRRYAQALAEYSRAVAIYPNYWDAWAGRGRTLKEMGNLGEAERSYERAVAANREYENGYFGLGEVRAARGDDAGAEDAYRRGLESLPKSLPLAYHLAVLSARLKRPAAETEWQRAVRLGSGLASVRAEHARWLWTAGRKREAAHEAREALRRDPRCLPALRLLADRAGDQGMALARALALEQIYRVTRSPEDLAALEKVGREDEAYARRFARLFSNRKTSSRQPKS